MPLDYKRAAQLCTARELSLVSAARSDEIARLTPERLKVKLSLSRDLRDKFRDLSRRQRRESRGTVPPRGVRPARGNARTEEKAALFEQLTKRFEVQLVKLDEERRRAEAREERAARARAKRKTQRSRRSRSATSAARPRKKAALHASMLQKQAKLRRSHMTRAKAHSRSQNRRRQARRDAR
jgi:hypothetical protein